MKLIQGMMQRSGCIQQSRLQIKRNTFQRMAPATGVGASEHMGTHVKQETLRLALAAPGTDPLGRTPDGSGLACASLCTIPGFVAGGACVAAGAPCP